jgi:hypothetical protein
MSTKIDIQYGHGSKNRDRKRDKAKNLVREGLDTLPGSYMNPSGGISQSGFNPFP